MIKKLTSNMASFKTVNFSAGLNVVLADITLTPETDSKRETRNGAGKSTLIDIIHFCLGSQVPKTSIFKKPSLAGWSFTLTIEVGGNDIDITRGTDDIGRIFCPQHELMDLEVKADKKTRIVFATVDALKKCLEQHFYSDLTATESESAPSFRTLISYAVRRSDIETLGFSNPFMWFKGQKAGSKQSCNAYFLGLSLEYALLFQKIKESEDKLNKYKQAIKAGFSDESKLKIGKLNDLIFELERRVSELREQLASFKVHPQYAEISSRADNLTQRIHALSNDTVIKQQLLSRYEQSAIEEDIVIPTAEIEAIYSEAGILFADILKTKLEEVMAFHKKLVENRKEYLQSEIRKLRAYLDGCVRTIKELSDERAADLAILSSQGALEEYTAIQSRLSEEMQKLAAFKHQLDEVEKIEAEKSRISIEKEELKIKSRRDYKERESVRQRAVSIFKENTNFLYTEPGMLSIDLGDNGYAFEIEIKKAKSQGVGYMKVFCYDLLLLQLGVAKNNGYPNFLVHDSTIFDGVDSRQIALALQLAKCKSDEIGAQYICFFNSDKVPMTEFSEEFRAEFESFIRLRLDDTETGGLLGIRFN